MNFENPKSKTCCQPALLGLGARVLRNSHLVLWVGFCEDHRRGEGRRAATRYRLVSSHTPGPQPQPPTTCNGPMAEHSTWTAGRQDQGWDTWTETGQRRLSISPGLGTKSKHHVTCYLLSVLSCWSGTLYLTGHLSVTFSFPKYKMSQAPLFHISSHSDLSTQCPPSDCPAVAPSNSFPAPSHYPQSPSLPSQNSTTHHC